MKKHSLLGVIPFLLIYCLSLAIAPNAGAVTPSGMVTDEFDGTALNADIWTYIDSVGDNTLGVQDGQASFGVPAGSLHYIWQTVTSAPRIMQMSADVDFDIEIKFDSPVTQAYQLQGLLVEEDAANNLWAEFNSDGTGTQLSYASLINGEQEHVVSQNIPDGAPLYLRFERSGDTWTIWYAVQASEWTVLSTFDRAMTVTAVGIFGGNFSYSEPPAHTTVIDYFRNRAAPTIEVSPADVSVTEPEAAMLTAAATGEGPLSFQWRRDGVDIAGATTDTLILEPTSYEVDSGAQFDVTVTNPYGSTTSDAAILTVYPLPVPPEIIIPPSDALVTEPAAATFTVVAGGDAPLFFQWRRDGVDIEGETTDTLVLDSTAYELDNGAQFDVTVTNAHGSLTSGVALLTVNASPSATPDNYSVDEGGTIDTHLSGVDGVLENDSDADGDALTASVVRDVNNGTLTLNADGSFTYVHDGSEMISDSFTYRAFDDLVYTDITTVSIRINPINDAPFATADFYSAEIGGAIDTSLGSIGGVLKNDTDPENDSLAAVLVEGVTNGTLTFNSDGTFVYIHDGHESASVQLTAGDGISIQEFGTSVVMENDTIVVGASGHEVAGNYAGAVYVFARNGLEWELESKLIPPVAEIHDWFGWAVDLEGNTLIIGAPGDSDDGTWSGSVFVYARDETGWNYVEKIVASDADAYDEFGVAVALEGDTLLIGAEKNDDAGNDSGAAYVFTRSGTTWTEQAKLTASDAAPGDYFGTALALTGDTAVITAPLADDEDIDTGAAYVFTRNGNIWTEQAKLTASDKAAQNKFGWSLAAAPGFVFVGASAYETGIDFPGAVYFFEGSGTNWIEKAKLTPGDGDPGDAFGMSIALQEDILAIGAIGDDDIDSASGSVYIFKKIGNEWQKKYKIKASDAGVDEEFGVSVATDGVELVVGANKGKWSDYPSSEPGKTYVYEIVDSVSDQFVYMANDGEKDSSETLVSFSFVYPTQFPPAIAAHPSDVSVTEPAAAIFTVVAEGDAPLTFQWRRDGVDLEGETADTYVLEPTSYEFDNRAQFDVVVTNAHGSITSDVAILTVDPTPIPPAITVQPADVSITEPAAAVFTVTAEGDAPLAFQWRRDGMDIEGETSDTFILEPTVSELDDGAEYQVVVSSPYGTAISEVAFLTVNPSAGIKSDDFDGAVLNTDIWTYMDPLGDSALGVEDGQVLFDVPAGTVHYVWQTVTSAPRIMQACDDVDFDIEVKFDSPVTQAYQLQGLLVEEDAANNLWAEFNSDGTGTQLSYANLINGEQDQVVSQNIPDGAPLYLRFERSGDTWTIWYAVQASEWTVLSTFDRAMTVTAVGIFGGNFSYSEPPAHTTVIDYFRNRAAPTIEVSPADVSVTEPAAAVFTVTAAGDAPLTFQWRRDGVNIEGANADTFILDPTSYALDDGAQFDVTVTNAHGRITSGAAMLTVNPSPLPPEIVVQPADVFVTEPAAAVFAVTAAGDAPLTFQWRRDGVNIEGANADTFILDPTSYALDDGAQFDVTVTNAHGRITSGAAMLTVDPSPLPPEIVVQPADVFVTEPAAAVFAVTAAGDAPLTFQWRRDGVNIEGANADTFILDPTSYALDDGAQFDVTVTNAHGRITSGAAMLTVDPSPLPPEIVVQPADVFVTEPAAAVFVVTAAGDAPLSFQWRRDGVDIEGETGDTFLLEPTVYELDDGAEYEVVVSNPYGTAISDVVFLTVTPSNGIVSDDFDGATLNTDIWTFINPLGDSVLGVQDGQVSFDVPAGTLHYVWQTVTSAPRIMQVCDDVDFDIEVKFDSPVTQAYQLQGLLVEEDAANNLWAEFNSDGTGTQLSYANLIDGEQEPVVSQNIPDGAPLYLRFERSGDTWTIWYAVQASEWTVLSTFDRAMTVTAVGIFGGNFSYSVPPAHTTVIDYFQHTIIQQE